MRGKNKCKILKEIRQRIADENDIPYVTRECSFQGECSGTCPKCEAELRYLEQQLEKRRHLGKSVAVAALAASLMAGLTACPSDNAAQSPAPLTKGTFTIWDEVTEGAPPEPITEEVVLEGRVPYIEPTMESLLGYVEIPTTDSMEYVIEGDVAYSETVEWMQLEGEPTVGDE